jgi:hypothetical protein
VTEYQVRPAGVARLLVADLGMTREAVATF